MAPRPPPAPAAGRCPSSAAAFFTNAASASAARPCAWIFAACSRSDESSEAAACASTALEVHRVGQRVDLLHDGRRRLHARVLPDGDRLRVALAARGQRHGVRARRHPRRGRARRRVVGNPLDRQAAAPAPAGAGDRLVVHVPDEAVHAGRGRQRLRLPIPVEGHRRALQRPESASPGRRSCSAAPTARPRGGSPVSRARSTADFR